MNARQINSTLYTSAAVCAAAAAAGILLTLVWPLQKQVADAVPTEVSPEKVAKKNDLPPLSAFESIWSMRLRQNLGAAPPPSATVAPMPTPPTPTATVPVTLVGTIGTSLAMLRTPSNVVEICGVGESIAGVEVLAVRPAEVDVTFNGRKITLVKPQEPEPQ